MKYRIIIFLYVFTFIHSHRSWAQPTNWEVARFKFKVPCTNESKYDTITLNKIYPNKKTYKYKIIREANYVDIYIIEDIQLLNDTSINDTSFSKSITLILNLNNVEYKFLLHNLPERESLTYLYLGEIEVKYTFYEYFISHKCCTKEIIFVNDRKTEIYNLTKFRKKHKAVSK